MSPHSLKQFPPGICDKLGFYVYMLRDPRSRRIFYVGKGCGNRVFSHLKSNLRSGNDSLKYRTIRSIRRAGREPHVIILRHGMTEAQAFAVEAAMIDSLPNLTNCIAGQQAMCGAMSLCELVTEYAAPKVKIKEPSILIRVNREYYRGMPEKELFNVTCGNWVVGQRREDVRYAFSVYNGIVRQVYKVFRWLKARRVRGKRQRWYFEGCVARKLAHYIGGNVSHYRAKGAQNPIAYVNC